MADRYRNFDEAWQSRKPITATVFGRQELFPPEAPAKLVTWMSRMAAEGRDPQSELREEELITVFELAFGEDRLTRWFDHDVDMGQLEDVLDWLMDLWMGPSQPDVEEVESGEALAPRQGAPASNGQTSPSSSAPTGTPSKPTSPASTAST